LFLCCFFVLQSNRSCATGGASSIATPEMLQPNPGVREVAVLFPAGSGFLFTLLASFNTSPRRHCFWCFGHFGCCV
jgi:hypothetical protein